MHNSIFLISDNPTDDILTEEEVYEMLNHEVDYVAESDLHTDIKTLSKSYNLKIRQKKGFYCISGKEFKKALLEEKNKKIDSLREYLNQDKNKIDLWMVANIAWPRKEYYFIYQGGVYNEMELLEVIDPELTIYIIQTFDYHW